MLIIINNDSDRVEGLDDISKYYKTEQSIYSKNVSRSDLIKTNWMVFEVVNHEEKTEKEEDNNKNLIAGILRFWSDDSGREIKIFMAADIDLETEEKMAWREVLKLKLAVMRVD